MKKKVLIASQNPVKIKTTQNGFTKLFPSEIFDFIGISVPSGVSSQPMGNEETLLGAINRTESASKVEPNADFG